MKGFHFSMDTRFYVLIILPLLISITLIRNLKLLAPFSQVANVAMFIGIGIILYYIFQDFPGLKKASIIAPPSRYTLFIGTTLFALEAVGVVSMSQLEYFMAESYSNLYGDFSIIIFLCNGHRVCRLQMKLRILLS